MIGYSFCFPGSVKRNPVTNEKSMRPGRCLEGPENRVPLIHRGSLPQQVEEETRAERLSNSSYVGGGGSTSISSRFAWHNGRTSVFG